MTTELTKAAQQALKPHQIAQLVNKLRDIAREFHAHDCLRELISQEVNSALTQRPAAQADDWRTPTTYAQRFAEAVALLCREMPPADMVAAWIDRSSGDHSLQDWACERAPAWAQGIGLLDAAHVMADQPTEGVNHEPTQRPAAQATPEPVGEHISRAEAIRLINALIEGDTLPPSSLELLRELTRPAPGVPDVEDLRDRLVAISAAVADSDDRAAQSMLGEILRTLAAAQAKGGCDGA